MSKDDDLKGLSPDDLVAFYRRMVLIRQFEDKTNEMYKKNFISGYCHLYISEEAVAVAALATLRDDDYVIGAYRDHGHAILRGSEPKYVMAELFGRADGVAKGKGGSMHMFNRENRFFGGDGIVAGELPVATGLAFAIEYRGGDEIVFCFFGDGAVNEGGFHEALNMATIWNLPVVFMCENNKWGMGTPVEKVSCTLELSDRTAGYCMKSERCDGMDILDVYDTTRQAVEFTRETRKPVFIEAVTQRFAGHSVTDPQAYRTKEEVEEARKRDPIDNLRKLIVEREIKSDKELDSIEKETQQEVDAAAEFAENSPVPEPEELCSDLYDYDNMNMEAIGGEK
jgi:pyruvate dehydrogenase E1 component alpha subunit